MLKAFRVSLLILFALATAGSVGCTGSNESYEPEAKDLPNIAPVTKRTGPGTEPTKDTGKDAPAPGAGPAQPEN